MAYSPIFDQEARPRFKELLLENPIGNLITQTENGLLASSLPFYLEEGEGELGTLYAHLGHYNPQTKFVPQGQALAIFTGVDAYISPNWMQGKQKDGKVVPTWDYVSAQISGEVTFVHESERLLEIVSKMTDLQEQKRLDSWKVSDAPQDYIGMKLKGIVGLKFTITKIRFVSKMEEQTKPETKASIINGLRQNCDEKSHKTADEISRL